MRSPHTTQTIEIEIEIEHIFTTKSGRDTN